MVRLVNIGFGNMVNASRIVAIIRPDSAPSKRIVQTAKEDGSIIDATQGRRTKSIIITADGYVVLSALLSETISGRLKGKDVSENSIDYEEDDVDE